MTTRRAVTLRAQALGATMREDGGRYWEVCIEAPAGYCWGEELHELVIQQDHHSPRSVAWTDALQRMVDGVHLCLDAECDWCCGN